MCIFLDEACVISSIFLRSDLQDFKIVGLPLHFLKFCDLQLIELLGKSLFFTRAMTLLFQFDVVVEGRRHYFRVALNFSDLSLIRHIFRPCILHAIGSEKGRFFGHHWNWIKVESLLCHNSSNIVYRIYTHCFCFSQDEVLKVTHILKEVMMIIAITSDKHY